MFSTTDGLGSRKTSTKRWLVALILATLFVAGIGVYTGQSAIKALAEDNSLSQTATQISVTKQVSGYTTGTTTELDREVYHSGDEVIVKWKGATSGERNFVVPTEIKVDGVTRVNISALNKIDSVQEANTEYERRMGSAGTMTTYDKLKSYLVQEHTVSLGKLTKDSTVEVVYSQVSPVYRMYNIVTSEHLFSTNKTEYDNFVALCKQDKDFWIGEGIDWLAPASSSDTYKVVHRLYNAALGAMGHSSHYYTADTTEMNNLIANHGWADDGVDNQFISGGSTGIYTCYNEALGSAHHYTSSKTEWSGLNQHGWALEEDKNGTSPANSPEGVFQCVMGSSFTFSTNYYTVEHQLENTSGAYTTYEKQFVEGTAGQTTDAKVRAYPGYTAKAVNNASINATNTTNVIIQYQRNEYTVTYDNNSVLVAQGMPAAQKAKYGDTVTAATQTPNAAERTFEGWYLDASGTIPFNNYTMPAGDVIVYAKWANQNVDPSKEYVNVNLIMNREGLEDKTLSHEKGKALDEPNAPSVVGWTFRGWYSDIELTQEYEFGLPLSEHITLYAKWTRYESTTTDENGKGVVEDPSKTDGTMLDVLVEYDHDNNEGTAPVPLEGAVVEPNEDGTVYVKLPVQANGHLVRVTLTDGNGKGVAGKPVTASNADGTVRKANEQTNSSGVAIFPATVAVTDDKGSASVTDTSTTDNRKLNVEVTYRADDNSKDLVALKGATVELGATNEIMVFVPQDAYEKTVSVKAYYETTDASNRATKKVEVYDHNYLINMVPRGGNGKSINPDRTNNVATFAYYIVTFDTEGVGRLDAQRVYEGALATQPEAPIKNDAEFKGWFDDAQGTTAFDFAKTYINDDKTIYAKYKTNEYTISYYLDNVFYRSDKVLSNNRAVEPAAPTKDGYTFDAWYTDKGLTNKYDYSENVKENKSLYGKWIANSNTKYTVVHVYEAVSGVASEAERVSVEESGTTGTAVNLTPVEKTGFTRSGGATQVIILADGSAKVEITYSRVKNTVAFSAGDNAISVTPATQENVKYGATLTEPTLEVKDGYKFDGWYSDAEFTKPWDFATDTMPETELNLFAKVSAKTDINYFVKHVYEALEGEEAEVVTETLTGTTDTLTDAKAKEKEGFTAPEKIENVTIAANGQSEVTINYTRNSYQVSLSNGGYGAAPTSPITVKYGALIAEPQLGTVTDHTLLYWTYVDGNGNEGTWNFATDRLPNTTLSLTAKWGNKDDITYTVVHKFEKVEGDGWDEERVLLIGQTNGTTSATAYNRTGFTAQTFEQQTIKGDRSTEVTIEYKRNIHKVTFQQGDHGKVTNLPSESQKYGKVMTEPTVTPDEGYVFDKWTYVDAQGNVQTYDFSKGMPDSDIELIANWKAATDTEFTINYYEMDTNGQYPADNNPTNTSKGYGQTEAQTAVTAPTKAGFETKDITQETIKGDGSTVVKVYYERQKYGVTFLSSYAAWNWESHGTIAPESEAVYYGAKVTLPTATADDGWQLNNSATSGFFNFKNMKAWNFDTDTMPAEPLELVASWTGRGDTKYTVIHKKESFTDNDYPFTDWTKEEKYGTTGQLTAATPYNQATNAAFAGFTAQSVTQVKIDGDGSTEVEILYKRNTWNVTWDLAGGTGEDTGRYGVKYGSQLTKPQTPTKEGYDFAGWKYYEGTTLKEWNFETSTVPNNDFTIFADWTAKGDTKYTIKHFLQNVEKTGYVEDASLRENLSGETGKYVTATTKIISGFTRTTGGDEVVSGYIKADGSLELKIYYNRNSYNVTFTSGDHGDYNKTEKLVFGSKLTKPEVSADGWTVANWTYTEDGVTKAWDFNTNTVPANGVTLTAVWQPNSGTAYKVVHKQQSLTSDDTFAEVETEELKGTTGELTKAHAKTYVGFTADQVTNVAIDGAGTTVVEIKYFRNTRTITLETGENATATPNKFENVKYGSTIDFTLSVKEGYELEGWYTDASYVNKIEDIKTYTVPDANTQLYAKVVAKSDTAYVVKYELQDLDNDANYTEDETKRQNLKGTTGTVAAATAFQIPGFTAQAVPSEIIKGDGTTVVTIKYTRNKHTVTFVAGDGATVEPSGHSDVKFGAKIAVPTALKAGYDLVGWYQIAAEEDSKWDFETSTMEDINVTLYAKWKVHNDTLYQIKHSFETLTSGVYEVDESKTENLYGAVNDAITVDAVRASAKKIEDSVEGFLWDATSYPSVQYVGAKTTTVVTLKYKRQSYSITFDGGTKGTFNPNTRTNVKYGATITAPTIQPYAGYHFDGWYSDDTFATAVDLTTWTVPGRHTTLYAKFSSNTDTEYTVLHKREGMTDNEYPESLVHKETKTGTTDAETAATALTFDGWTADQASITKATIKGDKSTTVEIKYTRNKYDIKFEAGEQGESVSKESDNQKYEGSLEAPTVTPKAGYHHVGWKWSDNEGNSGTWDFATSTVPAKNITITAQFEGNDDTAYKVEHYQQKAEGEGYDKLEEVTSGVGTTGEQTNPTPQSYTGFTYEKTDNVTITGDGNAVAKVYYTRIEYNITINNENSVAGSVDSSATGTTARYGAKLKQPTTTANAGYTFSKFVDQDNKDWDFETSVVPAKDVTLTAKWVKNGNTAYVVKHWYEGTTESEAYPESSMEKVDMTGETESTTTAAEKPKTGFTVVAGWKQDTIKGDGTTVINIYYTRNVHTVTFDGRTEADGSAVVVTPASQTVKYDMTVTEPNIAQRTGYTLDGWYTEKDGKGKKWEWATSKAEDKDFTLYANWKAEQVSYTIAYHYPNIGGDGEVVEYVTGKTAAADTIITAERKDKEGFTVDQKTLTGFAKADGTSTIDVKYTRDKYTVTLKYNDTTTADKVETKEFGENIADPNATREGYKLNGWKYKDQKDNNTEKYWDFTNGTVPAYNLELTADWTGETNSYVVKHQQENANDNGYTVVLEETKYGKTGDQTVAAANNYEGFTAGTVTNKAIEANNATVIEIKYTRNKYDVKFVVGDNGTVASGQDKNVKWGTKIDAFPTVTPNAGYTTDANWYTGLDYKTTWDLNKDTVPVGGVTLYKKFVAKTDTKYTVKHMMQNVENDDYTTTTETLTGTTGLMTAAKAKTDEGFTTPVIVNKPIDGNGTTVVELKYDRKKFSVTFKDGSDITTVYNDKALNNVKYGATIAKPSDPTKSGGDYRFDGWFQEEEFTNQWKFKNETGASTMPAKDLILYAKFYDLNDTPYTVIHKYETINAVTGASTGWEQESEYLMGQTGKQTRATLKLKEGFYHSNPYSGTILQGLVQSGGGTTVTIEYKRNSYNLYYKSTSEGSVPLGMTTLKYGQNTKAADVYPKDGYQLAKWVDQDGKDWEIGTPMPAHTVTLTAHYKTRDDVSYTVVHKREGLTEGTWIEETTTQYGTTGQQTAATAITSGDYAGFEVTETGSATIAGNGSTKVTITYKRKEHTVTLTGHDTHGKMTTTSFKQKYGTTIARPKFESTDAGYSVECWKYNGSAWNFETNVMPNNDITLTAEWSETRFKVHFTTDRWNGISGKQGTYSFTASNNTVPAELDGLTTLEGYKSKYWCEKLDGTGTQYTPGSKLEFNFDYQDQEVTLWAIWNTEDLSWSDFTVATSDVVYNATQQRPNVTSTKYKLNQDYKVTYGANKNVGKGTITITGFGYFKGEKKYEFNITQKPVEIDGITAKSRTYIAGNTTAELDLSKVKITGKIDGTDLSVSAKGNFADDKVGNNKAVTISEVTLQGADAANYKISKKQETTTASITGTYYNVVFHGNGSNNGMADYTQRRSTADNGDQYDRLLKCEFGKTSGNKTYGFKYWTTNADGTGTQYEDRYKGHLATTNDNQEVHLYAQWTSTELGSFWFAKSKTITKDNSSSAGAENPYYNKPEASVLWTQTEVEANVNMLISQISRGWTYDTKDAHETNYIKVFTDLMKNDEYHLYTKTSMQCYDYSSSELNYAEFRIIQVGQHDNDGTSLTFQSTHAMNQQAQIYEGDPYSGVDNRVNWTGWYDTDLQYWHLTDWNGTYTGKYNTQFNGGLNNWKLIKAVPKKYQVGQVLNSSTSKYWVMSPSELTDVTGAKGPDGKSWESQLRQEGSQYAYWKDVVGAKYGSANPAVLAVGKLRNGAYTKGNLRETAHHRGVFWLRDSYRGQSFTFQYQDTYFATTNSDGSANGGSDRLDSRGVVICFAVGL